ncbi:MAG: efflux RND transporter periplasmic adaptor subunit [Bryobacteraceae bacterium]
MQRLRSDAPEVPFARVQREELVSTLNTNGRVEPSEWAVVRAEESGVVARVPVSAGRIVAKGTVLAELRAVELRAELAGAEARVAQARAELETMERGGSSAELTEIESGVRRARRDFETAQKEVQILERLVRKEAATRVELDAAREQVRQAQLQIEALERKRGALISPGDRSSAQARLQEAQAAVELLRRRIERTAIRAPIDGTVYNLEVRSGAFLNPGAPVASIGNLEEATVRVAVDEPELGRVSRGLPVTITWDAIPGESWSGTVERMPAEIVPLGSRQVGEVLATIQNPGGKLVPGTNVNVRIQTAAEHGALTIPREAVRRRAGSGSDAGVWTLGEGNRLTWRKVDLGISSVTRVQVRGLSDGDAVALPTEQPLSEGQHVQPVFP